MKCNTYYNLFPESFFLMMKEKESGIIIPSDNDVCGALGVLLMMHIWAKHNLMSSLDTQASTALVKAEHKNMVIRRTYVRFWSHGRVTMCSGLLKTLQVF